MQISILNMVWPAIYVYSELWKFWFLIIVTIIIESITIKYFLKFSFQKTLFISLIGNLISGLIGTFLMMWAMVFWHFLFDKFVPQATFDPINWIATYILMCLGSVIIEVFSIRLIFIEKIRKLFLPLLLGNLVTYFIIAFTMSTNELENTKTSNSRKIVFLPVKNEFKLLDNSQLLISNALIFIDVDENGDELNSNYNLEILFRKENPDQFQFNLKLVGERFSGGIEEDRKNFTISSFYDTITVLLEQKNPDTTKGWINPIITDTIKFVKQQD